MGWMSWPDSGGNEWHVNLDGAAQIFYARTFADEKRSRARREVTENAAARSTFSREFNIYPDTVNINFDFTDMRSVVRNRATRDFRRFRQVLLDGDGRRAFRLLVDARMETTRDEHAVERKIRQAQQETVENINRAVRFGQRSAEGLETVQQISAVTLIVGSAFLTGGWSLAALGAGASLSGQGVYRDTGNVGAAVLTTTTSFVFGLIPVTRAAMVARGELAASERTALFLLGVKNNVLSETVTSLSQGRDLRTSVTRAMTNAGLQAVVDGVGESYFNQRPWPVRVSYETAGRRGRSAAADALTDRILRRQETPDPRGCWSLACAAMAIREEQEDQDRLVAENFVSFMAMRRPVRLPEGAEPLSGEELLRAVRRRYFTQSRGARGAR